MDLPGTLQPLGDHLPAGQSSKASFEPRSAIRSVKNDVPSLLLLICLAALSAARIELNRFTVLTGALGVAWNAHLQPSLGDLARTHSISNGASGAPGRTPGFSVRATPGWQWQRRSTSPALNHLCKEGSRPAVHGWGPNERQSWHI